jgi:hypothetical protein
MGTDRLKFLGFLSRCKSLRCLLPPPPDRFEDLSRCRINWGLGSSHNSKGKTNMKCESNILAPQVLLGIQEHRICYDPPSVSLAHMNVPDLIALPSHVLDRDPFEVTYGQAMEFCLNV